MKLSISEFDSYPAWKKEFCRRCVITVDGEHKLYTAPQLPKIPEGLVLAPKWLLDIVQPGYWHTVYMGSECRQLKVTYKLAVYERLMAEIDAAQSLGR